VREGEEHALRTLSGEPYRGTPLDTLRALSDAPKQLLSLARLCSHSLRPSPTHARSHIAPHFSPQSNACLAATCSAAMCRSRSTLSRTLPARSSPKRLVSPLVAAPEPPESASTARSGGTSPLQPGQGHTSWFRLCFPPGEVGAAVFSLAHHRPPRRPALEGPAEYLLGHEACRGEVRLTPRRLLHWRPPARPAAHLACVRLACVRAARGQSPHFISSLVFFLFNSFFSFLARRAARLARASVARRARWGARPSSHARCLARGGRLGGFT
jgi:hypothetical protein